MEDVFIKKRGVVPAAKGNALAGSAGAGVSASVMKSIQEKVQAQALLISQSLLQAQQALQQGQSSTSVPVAPQLSVPAPTSTVSSAAAEMAPMEEKKGEKLSVFFIQCIAPLPLNTCVCTLF